MTQEEVNVRYREIREVLGLGPLEAMGALMLTVDNDTQIAVAVEAYGDAFLREQNGDSPAVH